LDVKPNQFLKEFVMQNSANEFQQNPVWQAMIAELLFQISDEGNLCSLCFLDANQLLLDSLNYTKQELEAMKNDIGKNIFRDENYTKFVEILQNLVSNGHRAKYADLLKMKTKKDKNLWIFWKFTVLEWYKRDCPKIFLGWGIIDDDDLHAVNQSRKWLIEKNRIRNKAKNDSLTARELEVLPYINLDYTAGEIGDKLHVTKNAIEKRLQKIYRKLEVTGNAALAIYIRDNGLD
jgi:DNA-binding CsgD family transcriptional regulator